MKFVTIEEFNTYCNNFENDEDAVALKESIIEAASDIVKDYLGYNPVCHQQCELLTGTGSNKLYLSARPITGVAQIFVGGNPINILNIGWEDDFIYTRDGSKVFTDGSTIRVLYQAGSHCIPELIKMTTLRIAGLMLQESGGNIGLTGRNFADQSRSFINYSNYDKYLKPLDSLKTRIW